MVARGRLEAGDGAGGEEAALEVALEGVDGEATELEDAGAGPWVRGHGGERAAEDVAGVGKGGGGEGEGVGAAVVLAGETVGGGGVEGGLGVEVEAADDAVVELRHPAHEAVHPEAEVDDGEVGVGDVELGEDGEGEAEDGIFDGAFGELVEDLGEELEGGYAGVVDGAGKGRGDDLEGVEAD